MNKQELGFTLRAVGRYVRKLTAPISAEVGEVRRKITEMQPAFDAGAEALKLFDVATKRMDALEAAKPVLAVKGDPGEPGSPGKDAAEVSDERVGAQVARYLERNPPPKGDPGQSIKGDPGKEGPPASAETIAEQVAKYLHLHPPAQGEPGASVKGDRGEPGAAATIDHDKLLKLVDEACERRLAVALLDIERRYNETVRAFEEKARAMLAALPMPKDGRDGVGFDDLQFNYDGERTLKAVFARGGSVIREFLWRFPVPIDRGYWKEGFQAQKADAVTHDGTLWIAQRDTSVKPSIEAKDDWRIGARKGRDAAR